MAFNPINHDLDNPDLLSFNLKDWYYSKCRHLIGANLFKTFNGVWLLLRFLIASDGSASHSGEVSNLLKQQYPTGYCCFKGLEEPCLIWRLSPVNWAKIKGQPRNKTQILHGESNEAVPSTQSDWYLDWKFSWLDCIPWVDYTRSMYRFRLAQAWWVKSHPLPSPNSIRLFTNLSS